MRSYKVTAQSYTTSQIIVKTVQSANEADVLRSTSAELDASGFYIIDIKRAI